MDPGAVGADAMTNIGDAIVTMNDAEFVRDFVPLLVYSASNPSGVVAGKRWRSDRDGRHWLCEYVGLDDGIHLSRRVVVLVPAGAEIEAVRAPDPRDGSPYWLARHRGVTVTSECSLLVVADHLWQIERRSA